MMPSKTLLGVFIGLTLSILLTSCGSDDASSLSELTTTAQIRMLSTAKASRGYPVRLQGMITYRDQGEQIMFLQDATGGIPIDIRNLKDGPEDGTLLTLEGRTSFDGQVVRVQATRETVWTPPNTEELKLSPSVQPLEQKASWKVSEDLLYKVISVTGVVRSTAFQNGRILLRLAAGPEEIEVFVRIWNENEKYLLPAAMVGAQINVRGVLSHSMGETKATSQLQLYVPANTNHIFVQQDAPPLTAIPTNSIRSVLQNYQEQTYAERVFLRGKVQQQVLGQSVVLQDDSASLTVYSRQVQAFTFGEEIEVFGFPQKRAGQVVIEDASFRKPNVPVPPDSFNPLYVQSLKKDPAKVITTIAQLHALSPAEAAFGYPVRVKGIVTINDPSIYQLFIQDETGGTYTRVGSLSKSLVPGDVVEVEGFSDPGAYAPCLAPLQIIRKGTAPLPTAVPFNPDQVSTGKQDGRIVSLEGKVRAVLRENNRLVLRLRRGDVSYKILFQGEWTQPLPHHLLDATVNVQAVWNAVFNSRRQGIAIQFTSPGLERLRVIAAPAHTRSEEIPLLPIRSLLQYLPDLDIERTRIRGTVTLQLPDGSLYLRDQSNALQVVPAVPIELQPGDEVEATGFPVFEAGAITFREAILQRLATGPSPLPLQIKPQQAADMDFDHQLITLEARFLGGVPIGDGYGYTMQAGPFTFSAYLVKGQQPAHLLTLQPGSIVQLTGINRIHYERARVGIWEESLARNFEVLLPSAEAVTLRRNPPWWTVEKAMTMVVAALLLSIVVAAWLIVLRRRVHQQTAVIRQKLESEAALERRFQNLFDNAQDVVYTHDKMGRVISFNKAAEKLTGYTANDLDTLNIMQLVPPEHREKVLASVSQKVAVGDVTMYETEILTKDGRRVPMELNTTLVAADPGAPTILGIGRDITARKEIEARLQEAHDAAVQSAQMKSEFLANMSHEIRTPMNGVIGMAGLLLDTPLSSEQRDFAETVRNSAESLLTIINDILDFSKIEAGKLELENVDFDLQRACEEVLDLLAERADLKDLELTLLIHPNVPSALHGDPGRLRQVLLNLLSNGIKFTQKGEVGLQVTLLEENPTQTRLQFEIRDTGIGLSKEAISRLFKAFTQADSSTTRQYGGTGLGLSISKQLVEMMGGEIGVESVIGQGATFWFTLPLPNAVSSVERELLQPAALQGKRLLIVDDNATNRKVLRYQTTNWGMLSTEAESGAAALQLLQTMRESDSLFDMMLLDYHMPEMDGFELAQKVKADPRWATMPMIMMTSFTRRGQVAEALRIGITTHFTKPVRQSHLLMALLKVCGHGIDALPNPIVTATTATEAGTQSNHLILIVEDNAVNQKVIRRQVEKLGYKADLVGNGAEAMEALSRIPYHLVLMDCQMPVLDGYETTTLIRAQESKGTHTPIIALTANALETEREKCLAVGMDDYLTKPTRIEDLEKTLAHWLGKQARH